MPRRRDNFRASVCKKNHPRTADIRQIMVVQLLDGMFVATDMKRKLPQVPTTTHLRKTRLVSASKHLEFNLARVKAERPTDRMSRGVTLLRARLVQVNGSPSRQPSSSAPTWILP